MSDSDNVELKKRSRRRLVGAAALAMFAAIVLPMVMDQEPAATSQDIQITIPDRDANSVLSRPIAGQEPASETQLAPAPEEQAPSEPGRAAAAEAGAETQAAAVTRSGPSDLKSPTPASKDSTIKPPAKTDDAERVKAILEGRKPPLAAPAEGFVIQIGAFSESGKATSVVAELKKRGLPAYTEQAGAMTRVRIGPFASRDEADATLQRVRTGGFSGAVMGR